jgi:plastocyanin
LVFEKDSHYHYGSELLRLSLSMNPIRLLPAVALALSLSAVAAEPELQLVIKDHRFEPAELKVPAGQRIKLVVHNQDATPEEFESHSLNREKVVPAGGKVTIYIGPLDRGRYTFFGEYNEKTAQGAVVAE